MNTDESGTDPRNRALPHWDSEEVRQRVPNEEARVVYRVLYDTRTHPLTMLEIRQRVTELTGKVHEHTDRRLRDLRTYFTVRGERVDGSRNEYRYRLLGWRPDADRQNRRARPSGRTEAQVYSVYGARCAWCGRTPKDDGVRLVIDHKIPLELNGTNDVDNLQPLCQEHNHAKQAMYSEFEQWSSAMREAIGLGEAHLRIGELLKAAEGRPVPVDLINLVAREENRGDPTRRMRELRALGWRIKATRRKEGKRTVSYYQLLHAEPWPPEGPRAAINRMEKERKRRSRGVGDVPGAAE